MENEELLLGEHDSPNISENTQEVAVPEEYFIEDESVETQEVAEPVAKEPQSAEENSKYASARREAEAKAKALEEKLLKSAKALGYDSVEEYEKAIETFEKEKDEAERNERIEQFGYDPEDMINKAVEERLKSDPRFKAIETEEQNRKVNETIDILNKEFSLGIKTGEELDLIPNADKVAKLITAGFDIVEAYRMANYDTLSQNKAVQNAKAISNSGRADFGGTIGTPNPETVTVPKYVADSLARNGWDDDKIMNYYKLLQKNTR